MQASATDVMTKINAGIVTPIITGLFAVAVVYFLWGLFAFIRDQDNEDAQTAGKQHMVWGIIGIAIMLSVQGILLLIEGSVDSIL